MRRLAVLVVALAAGVLGMPSAPAAPAAPDECDWTSFRNGPSNPGASACDGLTPTNVPTLAPSLFHPAEDSISATPAVVDGVIYVGSWDGTFSALTVDGEPRWTFAIDDRNQVGFGRIVSSAAVAEVDGTQVVVFGGGATVYVLAAADGALLAKACLDPRATHRCAGSETDIEIESSPVVVGNDIVIGLDVHNRADVGRTGVVRLRLEQADGGWALTPVWKFDPEAQAAYHGPDALTVGAGTGGGCGGVWGTAAVDAAADLVVFGTASCSSGRDPTFVPAGEKVFGVRLSDGSLVWRFDPPRPWGPHADDDFGNAVQLFDVDGRLLAGAGSKDGWYYALDAANGAEVWKTQVGQPGHLEEDFAIGGMIGSPAVGEVGGEPAVFLTTAVPTPIGEPDGLDPTLAEDPGRLLSLHALALRDGRILWRSALTRPTYGHATYANGVLFVPSTTSVSVQAFHADTGLPLWTSPPLNGAPASGVAVTEDAIYVGVGTRQGGAGDPSARASGVWGFSLPG